MGARLIAVANMKGGVGKTTTVVGLAEALAASGARVLVVDLDAQASASVSISGEARLTRWIRTSCTLDAYLAIRVIRGEAAPLQRFTQGRACSLSHNGTALDLSLLPSGPFLRVVEREIVYELTRKNYTMNAIEGLLWRVFRDDFVPLRENYDHIIFDCAPGISPMTEIAVRSADLVIISCIPDFLSTFGLAAFLQTFWGQVTHSALQAPTQRPVVLATRYQRNLTQHRTTLERLRTEAAQTGAFRVFETLVPQAARFGSALAPTELFLSLLQKYGPLFANVLVPLASEVQRELNLRSV